MPGIVEVLTGFATNFVQIVENENIVLGALLVAFWLLFYGILSISISRTRLLGDDAASRKLGKIIAGTLAAIIVLGALAFYPPGDIITRAREIMSAFNVMFAVLIAIIIYLVFKYLLFSEENPEFNELASGGGALMALYFLSSIATNTFLVTVSTLGIFAIIGIAVWRLFSSEGGDETTFNDYNYRRSFRNYRTLPEPQQRRVIAQARRRSTADSHATLERIEREIEELQREIGEDIPDLERLEGEVRDAIAAVERVRDDTAQTPARRNRARSLHHQIGRVHREIEDTIRELQGMRARVRTLEGYQANIREIQRQLHDLFTDADQHSGEIEQVGEELNTVLHRSIAELNRVQGSLDTARRRIENHIRRAWERLQREVTRLTH